QVGGMISIVCSPNSTWMIGSLVGASEGVMYEQLPRAQVEKASKHSKPSRAECPASKVREVAFHVVTTHLSKCIDKPRTLS
ncbi:uncharacterized protein LY89DRAFT_582628, partial [Mollisia scopiformis]